MQGLIYIFIGLCGLGLGMTAYFGLAFTPIEAGLLALIASLGGWLFHERALRHRAEARLERGINELGRLLSTDAQAGQVLSQRVNALANLDMGPRLEVLEADISVLGTVVRQVAEAVSELETAQAASQPPAPRQDEGRPATVRRPTVPLETVRKALDEDRLVQHTQPIVTLPQRKQHALDLIPRLQLDKGNLIDPPEYMPVRNPEGDVVIRRIERICVEEAVRIVRRARLLGNPVKLLLDISLATLGDRTAIDQIVTLLAANRAVNPDLFFALDHGEWLELERGENDMLTRLVQQGAGLAIRNAQTLRLDFAGLANRGVRYLGVDTSLFLRAPADITDFHPSDIDDYTKRFGVNLVLSGVTSEDQILALLDDGIKLAQGNAIAVPGPIRQDLRDDSNDDLRQAAGR